MKTCVVVGCEDPRAIDSDRCKSHRWSQWAGPEWVRRARANALVAKEFGRKAA